jgi:Holliday junction DNA helicase RuvB
VANRLLRRVRDYAQVKHDGCITGEVACRALGMLEVDEKGLDKVDREILRLIIEKFDGGPVGLGTLAVAVGEERDTVEDVYEPYLLQRGLIQRTPRGRVATRLAYEHLGKDAPAGGGQLF